MNRTKEAYDRWSPNYDHDPNPQTALEEPAVMELVAPKSGERILDAACGTGRYSKLFQECGANVTGLDFSEGMLRVARSALPNITFHFADLTAPLPFADATFDKINCAQALKHLTDMRLTFREFARIVTPQSSITFSVTHPDMDWEGYEMSFKPSFVLSDQSDIHHHSFCDYLEAIQEAGLRVETLREVPVDETIREYLTPESFEKVKGRKQIAVFHLRKKA